MIPVITPATPEMAPVASILIYLTMGKMANYLFGSDEPKKAQRLLYCLFQAKTNRFSYQFTHVVTLSEKVAGLAVTYSGRVMKSLELPMAFRLIQSTGILGFSRFIRRAIPLFGIKEVENDEYFISNLAVLPEHQGKGVGKFLLQQIEKKAIDLGFHKLSLTVDVENVRAQSLYKQMGFKLLKTENIEFLRKRIGYNGFHRMVKDLR